MIRPWSDTKRTVFTMILPLFFLASYTLAWRDDLPWEQLANKLSSISSLIETTPTDYLNECVPEFFDKAEADRTNYALINQPSGLCMDALSCAFELCYSRPDDNGHADVTLLQRFADQFVPPYVIIDDQKKSWIQNTSNPSYNLPSRVLFPIVASDIVHAIAFAKEYGIQLSVKNSGHDYKSSSSKKDTLLINMNKYTQYASTRGIVECLVHNVTMKDISMDLSNQPCILALARGKSAFIRVGGGENWDKVYRTVQAFNDGQASGYKYHVIGGAAGTVSPMGWTFYGGLASTMNGRSYGFGADQVLQVEMVLPNSYHVRFGPTEWTDNEEGYVHPKTLSVSGVCRSNPDELDENYWTWSPCPDNAGINFHDLWFAVRGGGGGTWGVVASLYLQIHNYPGKLSVVPDFVNNPNYATYCGVSETFSPSIFGYLYMSYKLDFLYQPSTIGVSQEESDACSAPPTPALFCYGDASYLALNEGWKKYISSMNETLLALGVNLPDIVAVANCDLPVSQFESYAQVNTISDGLYAGKVRDDPSPSINSGLEYIANIIIPKTFVLENREEILSYLQISGPSYMAFGGVTAVSSDGADSVSEAYRNGSFMMIAPIADVLTDDFFTNIFPRIFDTSDKSNFPSFIGANHAGPNARGPRKEDWTKACPSDWTQKQRDDGCISLQELIWGTKLLRKLETVKEALDPNYMFDCHGCVGNNRVLKGGPKQTKKKLKKNEPKGKKTQFSTDAPIKSAKMKVKGSKR